MQETQTLELRSTVSQSTVIRQRVPYVDIAKGIGIILVVMGHNDFLLISPFVHKLIYSFHMPMFFFMSGLFFKPNLPFWTFIRNRYHKVLKPFLAILLLIYFASISFSKISLVMASRRLFKAMYGNGHYIDWVQLWFLPHLFAVSLFAYFFFRAVHQRQVFRFRRAILVVIYVMSVLSLQAFSPFELHLLGRTLTLYGLPFSVDLVVVSGFFFILGYETNRRQHDALLENPWVLVISGLALILLVWYFPEKIDLNIRQFDSLWINTLEAMTGILFILTISKLLERVGWLSSMFSYVGQTSLIVLIFQVPIQDYWGQKLLAITNNQVLSYWISFLAGVIGPILINALLIRPNPIVRSWFGQAAPQENKKLEVSVFE